MTKRLCGESTRAGTPCRNVVAPGKVTCARHDDERCCPARSKQNGDRCRTPLRKGAKVCDKHGGGSPQAKQAETIRAAELDAHALAERMVARAGTSAHPLEHLLDSLHMAAAQAVIWGQLVAELDATGELVVYGRDVAVHLHPFAVHHWRWVKERALLAKACLDAGIDRRMAKVAETQGQEMVQDWISIIDSPQLGLTAEQRMAARKALADRLRDRKAG